MIAASAPLYSVVVRLDSGVAANRRRLLELNISTAEGSVVMSDVNNDLNMAPSSWASRVIRRTEHTENTRTKSELSYKQLKPLETILL